MTSQQNNKYYVYRFLDNNNRILYVGRTEFLKKRLLQHFNNKDVQAIRRNQKTKTIQYVSFDKKTYSAIYEIYLINLWKPKYNLLDLYDEQIEIEILDIENLFWENIEENDLKLLNEKIYKEKGTSVIRKFNQDEIQYFDAVESKNGVVLTNSEKKILAILLRTTNKPYVESQEILQKTRVSTATLKRAANKFTTLNLVTKVTTRQGNLQAQNRYYLTKGGGI